MNSFQLERAEHSINCELDALYQDLEYLSEPFDGAPADEPAMAEIQKRIDYLRDALDDLNKNWEQYC